jgi:hypothetical protein
MRLLMAAAILLSGLLAADEPKVVRVPVSAADSERVLTAANFKAEVFGAGKAKVTGVRSPNDDLLVLVVTDLVGDLTLVDAARYSLAQEAQQLPPNVAIGLMRAQEGLQVTLDPTSDREALQQSLMQMPVNGKAGLLETVESVLKVAEAVAFKTNVRVAILYLTDSDVKNYREDFTNPVINSSDSRDLSRKFPEGLIRERISRLDKAVSEYQTPIFIVHVARSTDRLNEAYQSGLLQIATTTGGAATFCRSSGEIPQSVAAAMASIVSQYRVHVQLPAKSPKAVVLGLTSEGAPLRFRDRFVVR